ncbi:nuclear pore complex protein Nup98-Nup96-like isoform X2 [Episyrphus balteatus]|uniref:nuclear pore complex protein Nup98-Nup96-like isoform X2 n=1 Tax=Episyrphus balteatus TaxID=286459 RepID=UPI00248595F7|nr:nuclear pore complex protein Nup98-Nup96-like isoform X2 [Episyrphus balteatus]
MIIQLGCLLLFSSFENYFFSKYSIKVKQQSGLNYNYNNTMASSNNYGNRKITLTFQPDQPNYIPNTNIQRPKETIFEVPIVSTKNDPFSTFSKPSNEEFAFSVGPSNASNSFEVQLCKHAAYRVTFAETGSNNNNQLFGNRQTRTGSVYFDQGRQMNAFPNTNYANFGNSSAFGAGNAFGSSSSNYSGQNINGGGSTLFGNPASASGGSVSNQLFGNSGTSQTTGGSLFGNQPSATGNSAFGSNQLFGNSTTGNAAESQTFQNSQPTVGSFFGNKPSSAGSNQLFGNSTGTNPIPENRPTGDMFGNGGSAFGSLFGNLRADHVDQNQQMNTVGSLPNQPIFGGSNGQACGFSASKPAGAFSDKKQQINTSPNTGNSLFGQSSNCMNNQQQIFEQTFKNSSAGNNAFSDKKQQMNTSPNTGNSLFGQSSNCMNNQQPIFEQTFENSSAGNKVAYFDQGQQIHTNHDQFESNAFGSNHAFQHPTPVSYQPTFGSEFLTNKKCNINTKTNCITAMREYENASLEELRFKEYFRIHGQPSGNMPVNFGRPEQTTFSNPNTSDNMPINFGRPEQTTFSNPNINIPSQNMTGNTNQAFFEQLHKLIPYLNAGSFCKCNRSSSASKNQTVMPANNQSSSSRTNNDSLDRLYGNTQKSRHNDNMTIDEFYEDVFKYLEYIQKQYRHLESTIINKNANKDQDRSKSSSYKAKESKRIHKPSAPVFGGLACPKVKILSTNKSTDVLKEDKVNLPEQTELSCSSTEAGKIIIKEDDKNTSTLGTCDQATIKSLDAADVPDSNSNSTVNTNKPEKDSGIQTTNSNNEDSQKASIFGEGVSSITEDPAAFKPLEALSVPDSNTNSTANTSSEKGCGSLSFAGPESYSPSSPIESTNKTIKEDLKKEQDSIKIIDPATPLSFGTIFGPASNSSSTTSSPFGTVSAPVTSSNSGSIFGPNPTKIIDPLSSAFGSIFVPVSNSNSKTSSPYRTVSAPVSSSNSGSLFGPNSAATTSAFGAVSVPVSKSDSTTSSPFGTSSSISTSMFGAISKQPSLFGTAVSVPVSNSNSTTSSLFAPVSGSNSALTFGASPTKTIVPATGLTFGAFSVPVSNSNSNSLFRGTPLASSINIKPEEPRGSISFSFTGPTVSYCSTTEATNKSSIKDVPKKTLMFGVPDAPNLNFKFCSSDEATKIKETSKTQDPINKVEESAKISTQNLQKSVFTNSGFAAPPTTNAPAVPSFFASGNSKSNEEHKFTFGFGQSPTSKQLATDDEHNYSKAGSETKGVTFSSPSNTGVTTTSTGGFTFGLSNFGSSHNPPKNLSPFGTSRGFVSAKATKNSSNSMPSLPSPSSVFVKLVDKAMANKNPSSPATESKEKDLSINKSWKNPNHPDNIESGVNNAKANEQMNVQDGFVFRTSKPLNMKKISDELASLEANEIEKENQRKVSLTKSDTDSDISNYSLISNPSNQEDDKEKEENPIGIKMTRYGYYTIPSLDNLKYFISDDGACIVPTFTIGRKGYGKVCFNNEVNVTGINIDDLVHFRNKEIIIYPNENGNNTTIANDLKKCDALVILEQVWPLDEATHEPIKDPQHLDKIKYEDKLRLACHKNDIHFVEYHPETGSWLFKMKQFTKNNINCWNEEDDEDVSQNNQCPIGTPETMKLQPTKKAEEQGPPNKKIFF